MCTAILMKNGVMAARQEALAKAAAAEHTLQRAPVVCARCIAHSFPGSAQRHVSLHEAGA